MYKVSKLKNGTTLITVPIKGTIATTVLALFPVGSRFETPLLSGASHFLEHLLFKGTKKRPTPQEISKILDAVGADYNAYTYKDYTAYYVKIEASKQELAFDVLADMILNSTIDPVEMEREKGAIIEEIRMYDDNPSMAIDMLADQLVFGANPLGWNIAGSEKTVTAMSREDVYAYYQKHYAPHNMVLVVAGNIAPASAYKKYVRYFETERRSGQTTTPSYYKKNFAPFAWPTQPATLDDRVLVEKREVDQAQVVLNFPGLNIADRDRYAMSILLNILGGGLSSRLFVEVREKRGLVYSISASQAGFIDTGVCSISAGINPARLAEALTVIQEELVKITNELVTTEELDNAKNSSAGRKALAMEDSSAQAEWYAKEFMFEKKILTPEDVMKKLRQVTKQDVLRVAKRIFKWNEMRLAVIGPLEKKNVLEMLR